MSPRISHKSAMARKPTNITIKMPTNLTLTEPANIVPEADSQHHHCSVNGLKTKFKNLTLFDELIIYLSWSIEFFNYFKIYRSLWLWNLTIVYKDAEIKKSIGGSRSINRFKVSIP